MLGSIRAVEEALEKSAAENVSTVTVDIFQLGDVITQFRELRDALSEERRRAAVQLAWCVTGVPGPTTDEGKSLVLRWSEDFKKPLDYGGSISY